MKRSQHRAPTLTVANVEKLANVFREALRTYFPVFTLNRLDTVREHFARGEDPEQFGVNATEILWECYEKALHYPINLASPMARDLIIEAMMLSAEKPFASNERVTYPEGGPVFLHWQGRNAGTVDRFVSIKAASDAYSLARDLSGEGGSTWPDATLKVGRKTYRVSYNGCVFCPNTSSGDTGRCVFDRYYEEGAQTLSDELKAWCKAQSLRWLGADELILRNDLTEEQRRWLSDFILRWEALERGKRR